MGGTGKVGRSGPADPAGVSYLAARCCAPLSHIPARTAMITITSPNTTYGIVLWLSLRQLRSVAMSMIHTIEIGISTFQPTAISWSYRTRGNVPRSQTKPNSSRPTLMMNHSIGHQPLFAPAHSDSGTGARQPPRNSVVASADTVVMLMYSAR